MRRSLIILSGLVESITKMVTGCLRTTQVSIFLVWDKMERYATDLTFCFSFGFCFYFPLWLFSNFLISCLALPCPPVWKPKAVRRGIAIRAKVVQEVRYKNWNVLSCKWSMFFDMILNISFLNFRKMVLSKILWLTWLEGEGG